MDRRPAALVGIVVALLTGCIAPPQPQSAAPATRPTSDSRTLVMASRAEPAVLAAKPLQPTAIGVQTATPLFNAGLAILDDRGQARPYLAESLPELNTDTWRVLPNSRMETTYTLRPNLAWHDGTPVDAEDFIFARRVYGDPNFGFANTAPLNQIDEVSAPDRRTVIVRWRGTYARAGALLLTDLPPLPRHLLEVAYRQSQPDAFLAHQYWSLGYVGVGAYRLGRWEPGAFIEGIAFDGYALGRPTIERVRLTALGDANTTLASVLAGQTHITLEEAIYFEQASVLRREWGPKESGTVLMIPKRWRQTQVQLHPDRVDPAVLTDLRVRRALAHTVDKVALSNGLFGGELILSDSFVPPVAPYFRDVECVVTRYPYDPRRSEQLMADIGYVKGGDGIYAGPTGRLSMELKVIQSAQNESERTIMASVWRANGFEISEAVLPAAQAQDGQVRATFPGLFTTSGPQGEDIMVGFSTAAIPRPENRWFGNNRGSWANVEYDRLIDAFNATLDPAERARQVAQLARIYSEELPALPLYFDPAITAFTGELTGPRAYSPDGSVFWNVQEWALR